MTTAARRRARALKIWETRRQRYGPKGLPPQGRKASRENRRQGALSGWSIRKHREARQEPANAGALREAGVVILSERRPARDRLLRPEEAAELLMAHRAQTKREIDERLSSIEPMLAAILAQIGELEARVAPGAQP